MPQLPPLRDLARTAALKSNPHWPFSWTNRALYHAAESMFARTFSRDPEVSAIYVRHTMASGNWTPGSSDIDLSVILRPGLAAAAEFAFLQSFWRRFAALKRWWPMLGEVDLLDERELPTWLHYSAASATRSPWQRLSGDDVAGAIAFHPPARARTRALKTALWFYMDRFLPSLKGGDRFLEVIDRQRLARKILRLTGAAAIDLENDSAPLLARVLLALHVAAEEPGPPLPADEGRIGPHLPIASPGVLSVVCDYSGRAYVVVKDGLDAGEVEAVQRACGGLPRPVFLTWAMFRFLVRVYQPQQHGHFARGRAIAFGADPLPACEPPTREQIEGALLDQIPNALLYPRSSELLAETGPVPATGMAAALRQFLPILMVQSGEFTADQLGQVLPLCRIFGAREFERLQEIAAVAPPPTAQWEAFLLFKELSASIQQGACGERSC